MTAILQFHLGSGGQNGPSRGDLLSINIQRGRDHGLPSYNQFRMRAGLPPLNFLSTTDVIPLEDLQKLQDVYNDNIEAVDLFTGGIFENPTDSESKVGPTFASIMGETFRDLRSGDRFWYETDQPNVRFTFRQLREIRKASLARLICDNSDGIHQIQPNVFRQKAVGNDLDTSCDDLPFVGLQEWKVQVSKRWNYYDIRAYQ